MRRLLVTLLVLTALGIAIAALGFVLSGHRAPRMMAGDRVVMVALGGELEDYRASAPVAWLAEREPLHLAGLWRNLAAIRDDASVHAVAVRILDSGFGMAKAQEVRRQLAAVIDAGKPVACYLDTAGEGTNGTLEYFLATACSEISLSPLGELNLLGLHANSLFLRGSLDKLRIEPSFLAVGRYKSAAETFTERQHSASSRAALEAVVGGYYDQIVAAVAAARGLAPDAVRALVDVAPLSAEQALAASLVDRIEYPDEFRSRLEAEHAGATWQELADYDGGRPRVGGSQAVAIVFAQGAIVRGSGGVDPWTREMFIGSDGLGELLSELADDDAVRAVVLRVDSGGGSALASDLLHRRVELLRQKKPVVVSMSDLAASGGYYLAAKASRILAEPGTLTGSIGVVGGKLATGRFEEELLGVTRDAVSRGAHADLYSSRRPFDEEERRLLGARMEEIYRRFIAVVADGRSLPTSAVERVAEGRIWTGENAREHGLVDELGGFDAALAAARELAGLGADEGAVRFYPRSRGFLEWLAESQPPAFGGELARLAALLRAARAPGALELPAGFRELTRPF
ncbi:MAG TPA: signal peptide peptidase SppA [Thermoanaerobaculia bacterium]|nr:signal peptide peptidase SppA [Thermoanaerobaculia bacterium]